jgi:hypothetical protein
LPNQPTHVTDSFQQPNLAPNQPRAELNGFRVKMLAMIRQTFDIDHKDKKQVYHKPYPERSEYI